MKNFSDGNSAWQTVRRNGNISKVKVEKQRGTNCPWAIWPVVPLTHAEGKAANKAHSWPILGANQYWAK